jgi:hypothetical protein
LDVEPEVAFRDGRNKKENMKKLLIVTFAISLAGAMSASASITYSGTALSGLDYVVGNPLPNNPPSDAQYVPATGTTPALAALYTSDAGLGPTGDNPAVFVQGPLGTLSSFSASYHLYSSSGGAGNQPYWLLWVSVPGDNNPNDEVGIIGMGGPTLNGSSAIHVVANPSSIAPLDWGVTLSDLDNATYDGITFGQMTVDWAGVSIGLWDIPDTIGAAASFDSLTVVPEPTTMIAGALLLLPFGASTLRLLRNTRTA